MIKFNRLLDGLFYYNNCPLCDRHMTIKNEGFATMEKSFFKNGYGFSLIFFLEKIDKLIVDPVTEKVDIDYFKYNDFEIAASSCVQHSDYVNPQPISNVHYNYNDCFSIDIFCKNCNNFEYKIDLSVDLHNRKVLETNLSQTTYCVKSSKDNYFIINNFYDNRTMLFDSGDKYLIDVPIIEITKENLKDSLTRLRKLIIFS